MPLQINELPKTLNQQMIGIVRSLAVQVDIWRSLSPNMCAYEGAGREDHRTLGVNGPKLAIISGVMNSQFGEIAPYKAR